MHSEPVDVALDGMRRALLANVHGHIEWGRRLHFWKLLRLRFPDDVLFRYDVLAFRVVRFAAPLWRSYAQIAESKKTLRDLLNEVPDGVLQMYRKSLLANERAKERLCLWRNRLRSLEWDGCTNSLVSDSILMALMAITARVEQPDLIPPCMTQHADLLGNLDLSGNMVASSVDELNGEHDPYYFDYEFWISYAASLGPDHTHCPERRRTFWGFWLDECSHISSVSNDDLREQLAVDRP